MVDLTDHYALTADRVSLLGAVFAGQGIPANRGPSEGYNPEYRIQRVPRVTSPPLPHPDQYALTAGAIA